MAVVNSQPCSLTLCHPNYNPANCQLLRLSKSTPKKQGSSCDLAPTLLDLYDNLIAAAASTTSLQKDRQTHSSQKNSSCDSFDSSAIAHSRSCHNITFGIEYEVRDAAKDIGEDMGEQVNIMLAVRPPVIGAEDEKLSAIGQPAEVLSAENDCKKRPLSVSSTSSSVSSSSLPRHQRKKFAGLHNCVVAEMEQGSPSKTDLTSTSCCCSSGMSDNIRACENCCLHCTTCEHIRTGVRLQTFRTSGQRFEAASINQSRSFDEVDGADVSNDHCDNYTSDYSTIACTSDLSPCSKIMCSTCELSPSTPCWCGRMSMLLPQDSPVTMSQSSSQNIDSFSASPCSCQNLHHTVNSPYVCSTSDFSPSSQHTHSLRCTPVNSPHHFCTNDTSQSSSQPANQLSLPPCHCPQLADCHVASTPCPAGLSPGGRVPSSPGVRALHSWQWTSSTGGTAAGGSGSYMDKVVQEIINTERIYVEDLCSIIQGYMPFVNSNSSVQAAVCEEDRQSLFGNICQVYNFNRCFLESLESCEEVPTEVAQCFVSHSEGFHIYASYCTNYPRSVEILTKIMSDPGLSQQFREQQMSLNHALPLGSYLLKPVQRILKYHLLLENMLNNMEKSGSGHEVVSTAFNSMTRMAQHINEMKRQHERAVHVQEIQSTLLDWRGDDLTTYGHLVMEESFRLHGAKASRQLYLFEKGVIIAKKKDDSNLQVKGSIMCSNLMLIEHIPKEPLSFHLIPFDNPRCQYTVQAKNLEHKRQWCQQLKKLILENYSAAIPEKAKELVMMLGKSKEEEKFDNSGVDGESLSAKKQHSAPEYLEKWRRRKSASIVQDFVLKSQPSRKTKADGSPKMRRKSDLGQWVSYLARKSSAAGEMKEVDEDEEEDDYIMVLDECPSSSGGSSKASTLEREDDPNLLPNSSHPDKHKNQDLREPGNQPCEGMNFSDSATNDCTMTESASVGPGQRDNGLEGGSYLSDTTTSTIASSPCVQHTTEPSSTTTPLPHEQPKSGKVFRMHSDSGVLRRFVMHPFQRRTARRSLSKRRKNTPSPEKSPAARKPPEGESHSCKRVTLGGLLGFGRRSNSFHATSPRASKSPVNATAHCVHEVLSNPSPHKTVSWTGGPISSLFRQFSVGAVDRHRRRSLSPPRVSLKRSNSWCTVEDRRQIEPGCRDEYTSPDTLFFLNRRAFIVKERPHTVLPSGVVQETVMRLATPPREEGPEHYVEEVQELRNKERVFHRYGTPPRQLTPGHDHAPGEDMVIANKYVTENLPGSDRVMRKAAKPHASYPCTPTHVCNTSMPMDHAGSGVSCRSQPPNTRRGRFSPSVEGFVNTFRNAVHNLTSKITRHSHDNHERVTSSSQRRARSLGAEEDCRVDGSEVMENQYQEAHKDMSLLSQFTHACNNRLRKSFGKGESSKQSSCQVKDSLPQNTWSSESDKVEPYIGMTGTGEHTLDEGHSVHTSPHTFSSAHSSDADNEDEDIDMVIPIDSELASLASLTSALNIPAAINRDIVAVELSDTTANLASDPQDYYYEEQFNNAVEMDVFRDSAVYSDDGAQNSLDSDVSNPEQRRVVSRPPSGRTMTTRNKTVTVRHLVNSFENGAKLSSSSPTIVSLTERSPQLNVDRFTAFSASSSPSLRTKWTKTRELEVCAMLSRIRQNSYDSEGTECKENSPVDSSNITVNTSRTMFDSKEAAAIDALNVHICSAVLTTPTTPTNGQFCAVGHYESKPVKGWVKDMVNHLQPS